MSDYLNKMNCQSPDHDMYQEAEKRDDIESYEAYLAKYPNGMYLQEAKEKLEICIRNDHNAYNEAVRINAIASYETYLSQYPNGLNEKLAMDGIDIIKEEIKKQELQRQIEEDEHNAYDKAVQLDTKEAYEKYLANYPSGLWKKEAKERLEICIRNDHNAYSEAVLINTLTSYETYLSQYPNGLNAKSAMDGIDIIKEEIKKQELQRQRNEEAKRQSELERKRREDEIRKSQEQNTQGWKLIILSSISVGLCLAFLPRPYPSTILGTFLASVIGGLMLMAFSISSYRLIYDDYSELDGTWADVVQIYIYSVIPILLMFVVASRIDGWVFVSLEFFFVLVVAISYYYFEIKSK